MRALLKPVQRWVWGDAARRGLRLLRFSEVEADGGRDLVRAAELTSDPRLRKLYLRHAGDERRHADIFRTRALELLRAHPPAAGEAPQRDWLAPGERGLDDVEIGPGGDAPLLAFLHLSEANAARDFAVYRDAVGADDATRAVFERILRDEVFHMNYTKRELERVSPARAKGLIWRARLKRVWKAYLRFAVGLAGIIGGVILTLQYFILLPPFAWISKRAARREAQGWVELPADAGQDLRGQY
ncbi:MAG TPA: ferritin-like domain-containing protein [Allosphingosinicella sp.]|nr:ferritin-like domain-containing protein [Allosphingosinicella sp.]